MNLPKKEESIKSPRLEDSSSLASFSRKPIVEKASEDYGTQRIQSSPLHKLIKKLERLG